MTVALPWSCVGLCTGYRGNPRVSTARATAFRCTWRFHGKCHGCGHGTCRGSVRGNLPGTNHGNPRKYHGNCHGLFRGHLHVNCCGNPRQSTANATAFHVNCHGNSPTASAINGNQRRMPRHSTSTATVILPRQVPWQYAAIATALHGNCHGDCPGHKSTVISTGKLRHSAAIRGNCQGNIRTPRHLPRQFSLAVIYGNFHGKPRHSAAIAKVISTATNGELSRQLRRQTTAFRGHPRQCHGNFCTPRQSAVIATAISTAINGNCHVNRR